MIYRLSSILFAASMLILVSGCATSPPVPQPIAVVCPKPVITPTLLQMPPELAWDRLMTLLPPRSPSVGPTGPTTQP